MKRLALVLVACSILLSSVLRTNAQQIIPPDDSVWGFAWSPDSKQIAVGRYNGNIELVNANSKEIIQTLATQVNSRIASVVWSPDGETIAASNKKADIFFWNAKDSHLLRQVKSFEDQYIISLVFSPDNSHLAGISDPFSWLQIWDVNSGDMLHHEGGGELHGLDWINNSIVSATSNGIGLFDASTGEYIKDIGWHNTAYITSVDWSPDGSKIASGSMDGTVRIGDSEDQEAATIVPCDSLPVSWITWHPDGTKLAGASLGGLICIWNSITGDLLTTIKEAAPILNIQWSPDGNWLAYSGDSAGLGGKIQIVETDKILPLAPTPSMSPA
jgi:WD40 repeat protein